MYPLGVLPDVRSGKQGRRFCVLAPATRQKLEEEAGDPQTVTRFVKCQSLKNVQSI